MAANVAKTRLASKVVVGGDDVTDSQDIISAVAGVSVLSVER